MRVALFGNIANSLYRVTVALRDAGGIDAHLYVDPREGLTAQPESDDPSLADGYPPWIHTGSWLGPRNTLLPWRSDLVEELRSYDLVIASGSGPAFAQFSGGPWCFLATGGDLTVRPFPLRFWTAYPTTRTRLSALVLAAWQRRGIRRATEIWTQPFAPMTDALRALGLTGTTVSPTYMPLVVDPAVFSPGAPAALPGGPAAEERLRTADFVVLHPSRLMMDDHPRLRATGQWKRNDVLIKGFAQFVHAASATSPVLVMPDTDLSPNLSDAKDLVRDLGIDDQVLWLRPTASTGFDRVDLLQLYRRADVVADDFGVGWFGLIALEALSTATPVVTYVDEAVMASLYPWQPMCSAREPADVCQRLLELCEDAERRRAIGADGRRWIEEFHAPAAVRARYVVTIRDLMARLAAVPPS